MRTLSQLLWLGLCELGQASAEHVAQPEASVKRQDSAPEPDKFVRRGMMASKLTIASE
jgi:hypothetical protein